MSGQLHTLSIVYNNKKLEVKCQQETSLDNCDGQPSKKGPVKTIIIDMESCS